MQEEIRTKPLKLLHSSVEEPKAATIRQTAARWRPPAAGSAKFPANREFFAF
jgi:hypothetical protein